MSEKSEVDLSKSERSYIQRRHRVQAWLDSLTPVEQDTFDSLTEHQQLLLLSLAFPALPEHVDVSVPLGGLASGFAVAF